MNILKNFMVDKLQVKVMATREDMGKVAGEAIVAKIVELQKTKDELNMIFAAAPSQNEVLEYLRNTKEVDWTKINAFHMDEYIGLDKDAPQGFGNFLRDRLFGLLPFKSVNYIDCSATDAEAECARYSELLKKSPIDIVCLGIGENAHIAFNDPGFADFEDKELVKVVELDEVCRNQQVNDGCFEKIDDVPKQALTLTVPMLFSGDYLFCTVPAPTKANAVYHTVNAEITADVPATVMRRHDNAIMFCDNDSGEKVL